VADNLAKEAATADEVFESIWTDYCPEHILKHVHRIYTYKSNMANKSLKSLCNTL